MCVSVPEYMIAYFKILKCKTEIVGKFVGIWFVSGEANLYINDMRKMFSTHWIIFADGIHFLEIVWYLCSSFTFPHGVHLAISQD